MDEMYQTLNYRNANDIAPKMQVRQVIQELMFNITQLSRRKYEENKIDIVQNLISILQNMLQIKPTKFNFDKSKHNLKQYPAKFVEYAINQHRLMITKMMEEGWWINVDVYEEI